MGEIKPNIFIISDQKQAKEIQKKLQRFGYVVPAISFSAKDSIQKVRKYKPDLILIDVDLKGDKDGIEIASQINSIRKIPIIYIASKLDEEKIKWMKSTSPFGYIQKPFDDRELEININMALYKAEMEHLLHESREWFFTVLKSIGDGVIVIDLNNKIKYLNKQAEEITGWTEVEAVGKPLAKVLKLVSEKDEGKQITLADKVMKKGRIVEISKDILLIDKNGNKKNIYNSGAPIYDKNGNFIGIVFIINDITNERRRELEFNRLSRLDAFEHFSMGIANQFNNILTAILGNISIARMDVPPDSDVLKAIQESEKSCMQAKDLIQQLLSFAEGGAPNKELCSIQDMIKDSANFVLCGSAVSCEFNLPDGLWKLKIDKGQISQVICNAVINAFEAIPGKGKIKINARNIIGVSEGMKSFEGKNMIKVTIKDNGFGIEKKMIENIFDPYFTTKEQRVGLGLSISHTIVKNHKGLITVESKIGKGTKLNIYLPSTDKPSNLDKEEKAKIIIGEGNILVMDDQPEVLEVLSNLIEQLGYRVTLAQDGKEAVSKYKNALNKKDPFDTVILDLIVPEGMGGGETIKRILKLNPKAKVIISSGYANDPILTNYINYGFCGVLTKPFTLMKMGKILYDVIKK